MMIGRKPLAMGTQLLACLRRFISYRFMHSGVMLIGLLSSYTITCALAQCLPSVKGDRWDNGLSCHGIQCALWESFRAIRARRDGKAAGIGTLYVARAEAMSLTTHGTDCAYSSAKLLEPAAKRL
jgi:hypothetical protein